jgi:phosphoribosylaminoimidazolecarboxamide formyltransferase / IMP cyclohydrolase
MTTRRALLSVSDKTGLIDFARGLHALGFELLSTGGSAKALREQGLAVRDVAEITGFPEIMDGRVKTLHPKVHGALLGRLPLDQAVMTQHGIDAIDVVAVNLYPFAQTIAKPDCTLDDAIENIDIGGPAMLRAAAKNHARVWTLCDPLDYSSVLTALASKDNAQHENQRRTLAAKVYAHTADYDGRVAGYLSHEAERLAANEASANAELPPVLTLQFERVDVLRYGENPHQHAALYRERPLRADCVTNARFLQGKALSYNNIADADAALETVRLFDTPACVIVKHANPCGVACSASLLDAYQAALATDPVSAFGGIVAFNREVDEATAKAVVKLFVEVVIAPGYSESALKAFATKSNVRVLTLDNGLHAAPTWRDYKRVQGGLLVQSGDSDRLLSSSDKGLKLVSTRAPSPAELSDLHFAWKVAMQVKSNAIVYAKAQRTIGVGAGQMSRVVSAKIAGWKAAEAGLEVHGSVMASDAFFPFRDGIDAAASVGITAVIQPGGSMRDQEVIDAANAHGMAMVFTGVRHFKH